MTSSLDSRSVRLLPVRAGGPGAPPTKRLGLVVLATDHTSESDFRRLLPAEAAALYVSRVAYSNPTTADNLRRMQPRLTAAAELILPDERLDALVYACTAASMYIGEAAVAGAFQAAKPGVPVITPVSAALAAFAALGVRRLALLTPYRRDVTEALGSFFESQGLEIVGAGCFGLEDDREMARVAPEAIRAAAVEVMAPAAEALFVSCTALPAACLAGGLEAELGQPVVTSNQAAAWRALRTLGWDAALAGQGRLFTLPAPDQRKAG